MSAIRHSLVIGHSLLPLIGHFGTPHSTETSAFKLTRTGYRGKLEIYAVKGEEEISASLDG